MRSILITISLIVFSYFLQAQTLCGTANEGQTLTMTAPSGQVFVALVFASYGTPNGSCGSFTQGACHASNSATVVQGYLIGHNSANIPATNGTFGDPCVGTGKRLYVQAIYGSPAPLRLISFAGSSKQNDNTLKWETTDEVNTKQFEVERSNDGINFLKIGTVTSNNTSGSNFYSFIDNVQQSGIYFYRLKMVDVDGKFTYSNIIKLSGRSDGLLKIFPNPTTGLITVSGTNSIGKIEVINAMGITIRNINIIDQTQIIDISGYSKGLYVIKYVHGKEMELKKILVQ